jgi:hypothetical protein
MNFRPWRSARTGRGRRAARRVGLAAGLAVAWTAATLADDIKVPTDPVAKAAFDVLAKSCARCHQEGRLTARERPAKNFGFVLRLDELAANPNYVLPGNPYGSKLFKQIVDKEMPYDVMYEGAAEPSPSADDIKALETWIQSLGTQTAAACTDRKFVSNKDMIAVMAADLEKLPRARVKGTRYLTLTHLRNACTDDAAMKVYRQGTIKLINSLSRSSDVVRLETIDPEQTIIRINIDDLGWEPRDWDNLLSVYPYNTQPETQLRVVLASATGTPMPYARADWFAFTASRPPFYNTLLRLPRSFQLLARSQGVDVDADIRKFLAQRAGFQKSGVSQNNRLIERHAARSGYFWTSYDFAGNRQNQSLFEFPLGPGGSNGFSHDGGETIFSLPNGFQAYYLNNARSEPLDKGPTNIVRDLTRKDLAVTNGVSCMGCHDQGMRKAKDDIRAAVLADKSFPKDVREAVEGLYPPQEKMDRIIEDDAKRFAEAMTRAGLEPTLKLNGVEMINALSKRYEDDVDAAAAAAEFGLTKDEFAKAAADADKKFRPFLRRLQQGIVPRDQFEVAFHDLSGQLTEDEVVIVVGVDDRLPVTRPAPGADLSLISDRDVYRRGDTPVFTVVAARDCFLTLTDVDQKGEGTVLFPNRFQQNNRIRAGAAVQLPGDNASFQYRMKDRGFETVIAVCTETNTGVDGIQHDFSRSAFTSIPDYTGAVARSIVVEAARPSGPTSPIRPATDPMLRQSYRAAIRVEVR